jgi:hypothetical protein
MAGAASTGRGSRRSRPQRTSAAIVVLLQLLSPSLAAAATKTWDGGGSGTNCSTTQNWSGDSIPTVADDIVLDSTSTKDLVWDSGCPTAIRSWSQNTGYTGGVSFGITNVTMTGAFKQAAGSFTAPSGTMKVGSGFVVSSGTFSHNNGTVLLSSTGSRSVPLTTASTTLSNLSLDNGLIGYWKLDEGIGTAAKDSSRFGNNGTLIGAPVWSGSSLNTRLGFHNPHALRFDGSDDLVSIDHASVLNAYPITTSAWIKTVSTNEHRGVVNKYVASSLAGYQMYVYNGEIRAWYYRNSGNYASDGGDGLNGGAVNDGAWHFVVFTVNAAGGRLYVDGVLEDSVAWTGTPGPTTTTQGIRIGHYPNGVLDHFAGAIDDVRIYSRALSASEILALYNGGRSTGSGTYTLSDDLDVDGSLSIYAGTLDVSSSHHGVAVARNLASHGDFTKRSGTVTLDGSGHQTVSGSIVFHNLTKTASAASTLFFDYTARQSASGALTLQGAVGNLLSLRSTRSGSGSRVLLDADSGTQTIRYLNVKDSNASGGATLVCHANTEGCVDAGNNTNWTLSDQTFSLTGRAFSNAGLALLASGKTVAVSLNGGAAAGTDTTDAGGEFTVTGLGMTGGTIITVYLDGNSEKGVTVTLGSGSAMTGVNLYQNHLITRSDSGSVALTNNHLSVADNNGDADITSIFTVDSSTLNVKSGKNLLVWAGDTFTPGNTVNVGSGITIDGTLVAGANTITLSGSWLEAPSGAFTAGTSTVALDGANQTLSGSTTFYDLTKVVTSAATLAFAATTTQIVTNTLTLAGAASNMLSLRSTQTGTQWNIDPQATRTISYLDVKDSGNINATAIDATDGTHSDGGNNTNWTFPTSVAPSSSGGGTTTARTEGGGGTRGGRRGSGMQGQIETARVSLLERYRNSLAQEQAVAPSPAVVRRGGASTSSSEGSEAVVREQADSSTVAVTTTARLMDIAERRGKLVVVLGEEAVLYRDVDAAAWYAPYVAVLATEGIAQGYKDEAGKPTGEFGIANPVTRAEMLKMALQAAGSEVDLSAKLAPRNRSARGTWAEAYVRVAEDENLTVFASSPDIGASATRAEVVQTVLEAMGFPIGKTASTFADVPGDHPHSRAIALAAFNGFIEGDRGPEGELLNRFRPDDAINRAEVAKLIALVREVAEH